MNVSENSYRDYIHYLVYPYGPKYPWVFLQAEGASSLIASEDVIDFPFCLLIQKALQVERFHCEHEREQQTTILL